MIISNCILNAAIENIKIGRNQTQAEFIISSLRRNNAEFKYHSLCQQISTRFNRSKSVEGYLFWTLIVKALSYCDGVYLRDNEFFELSISGFPDDLVRELIERAIENPIR